MVGVAGVDDENEGLLKLLGLRLLLKLLLLLLLPLTRKLLLSGTKPLLLCAPAETTKLAALPFALLLLLL